MYALVAYGVLLFERRPQGLALVAFFAVWAMLLASQTTAYYVLGVGLTAGVVGLLLSRVVTLQKPTVSSAPSDSLLFKFTWGWPWYLTPLVAAVILGFGGRFSANQFVIEYGLLAFAVLAYVIGVVEDMLVWSWIGVILAIWSLLDAAIRDDPYRLFTIALVCSSAGPVMAILRGFLPALAQRRKHLEYALPFYVTALAAAVLTGFLPATFGGKVNSPFYAAIPDALLLYALVAYGVSLIERRVRWLWLVAGFTLWGTLLIPQTVSCLNATALSCNAQFQTTVGFLTGVALLSGIFGLLAGRFIKPGTGKSAEGTEIRTLFTWSWPWYLTSLVTMIITANFSNRAFLPHSIELSVLCSFIVLSLLIMLVERIPEMLVVPVALAAWAIAQIPWNPWQLMIMYNLLCVLIFASQFVWKVLSPATHLLPATRLHKMLGLGGQGLVVLAILSQGGFLAGTGVLGHVGAGSLLVFALLIFWFGCLHSDKAVRRWCDYGTGLFLSLAVSWELSALGQTHIDILLLAPASYLVVIAPFLSRDETLPQHRRVAQICSIIGAICLLLPALWFSFGPDNLQPILILAGESLALLLLGIGTRIRIFALSGAGFVIISAIHALFLPSLGIPTFLALAILGGVLLAIATTLKLIGRRLQIVLTEWD